MGEGKGEGEGAAAAAAAAAEEEEEEPAAAEGGADGCMDSGSWLQWERIRRSELSALRAEIRRAQERLDQANAWMAEAAACVSAKAPTDPEMLRRLLTRGRHRHRNNNKGLRAAHIPSAIAHSHTRNTRAPRVNDHNSSHHNPPYPRPPILERATWTRPQQQQPPTIRATWQRLGGASAVAPLRARFWRETDRVGCGGGGPAGRDGPGGRDALN